MILSVISSQSMRVENGGKAGSAADMLRTSPHLLPHHTSIPTVRHLISKRGRNDTSRAAEKPGIIG
jgi:hypothetical protein